jgi:hypothetical protein
MWSSRKPYRDRRNLPIPSTIIFSITKVFLNAGTAGAGFEVYETPNSAKWGSYSESAALGRAAAGGFVSFDAGFGPCCRGETIPATPPTAADATDARTASAAMSGLSSTTIKAVMQITDNAPITPSTIMPVCMCPSFMCRHLLDSSQRYQIPTGISTVMGPLMSLR